MSLATLGAVLKFALDMETRAKDFYEKNANIESFKSILSQYEKRIKRLKKIRRENTTEMILEPIVNFNSESYNFTLLIEEETDENTTEEVGKIIEETLEKFYSKSVSKVSFLSEVSHKFKEIALEHKNNFLSM